LEHANKEEDETIARLQGKLPDVPKKLERII
jgi:hypothetical protein